MKSELAHRIRSLRVNAGWSQQQLADELNITPSAYSNIERGKCEITMTRLFEIARLFRIHPKHFFVESRFMPLEMMQPMSKSESLMHLNVQLQITLEKLEFMKKDCTYINARIKRFRKHKSKKN